MRRYYTRVCNFYYGHESRLLVNSKKAIPLNGNKNISFDRIEIISRISKKKISISKINSLSKSLKELIKQDLKKIRSKKKNFSNLNFLQIPNIMGVLNLTPDSFSDGGNFNTTNKGLKHASEMFGLGANIIDIGGESTRPGSKSVDNKIEWKRIEKIIQLIGKKIPISLDTRKSEIMNVLKKYKIPFVIQHSQGTPENMQNKPRYKNELLDIYDFFEQKINYLKKIGIKHNNIIIDPGIGFGKNLKHNINLISKISIFHSLGFPILVGNSRKRFIKEIAGKNDSKSRVGGTMASSIYLMMQGIQILRIHDVNEILQGIKVFREIVKK